jgi:hypothetical protein
MLQRGELPVPCRGGVQGAGGDEFEYTCQHGRTNQHAPCNSFHVSNLMLQQEGHRPVSYMNGMNISKACMKCTISQIMLKGIPKWRQRYFLQKTVRMLPSRA